MADVLDVYEAKVQPKHASGGLTRLLASLGPWRHMISALVIMAVLAVVWFAVERLLAEVTYQDVVAALRDTPWSAIGIAALFTVGSFAALTVYDFAAIAHIGRKLPYSVIAYTAFCAYAVGNTAGFGPLTGGTIRYRFYAPLGAEPENIARIVAFVTLAFMLGLVGVMGVSLLVAADHVASILSLPPFSVRALAALVLLVLSLLPLVAAFGERLGLAALASRLPRPRIMLLQLAATFADVLCAAVVLWVLLPANDFGFFAFVAVYGVALGLGVLSHVPAGLGVFETVMVATVGREVPADQLLGALVLYRLIYHVLPLLIASAFVTLVEVRRVAAGPRAGRFVSAGGRLAPPVLGALTLVMGAMLVFSGVTPAIESRLDLSTRRRLVGRSGHGGARHHLLAAQGHRGGRGRAADVPPDRAPGNATRVLSAGLPAASGAVPGLARRDRHRAGDGGGDPLLRLQERGLCR
jgi:phosphatidylglycerol lysyltransferase